LRKSTSSSLGTTTTPNPPSAAWCVCGASLRARP
jgi:hypothetical protein